ncbi:hypothetical protein TVD_13100 [Thioalkalivibrio versutus]|uniref:Uncharacterized protein n=1 Tax=Thioalkalivibrio versutus TaxID=106634 RepID=A0A0G3G5G5_9GAMM|nr:hypothetical protein [Thioalkalivibrio versutus]AKJ96510.1 hypothetical protein TVD_13100 [Thioalkalivibrio versutus]
MSVAGLMGSVLIALIPMAVAIVAAIGVLIAVRRASAAVRIGYALLILALPVAVMLGFILLLEEYGREISTGLPVALFAFIGIPLMAVWWFRRRHPVRLETGAPVSPTVRSFRLTFRYWRLELALVALVVLVVFTENPVSHKINDYAGRIYLNIATAHFDLSGHKFDVPVRFFYSVYEELGHWPYPREGRHEPATLQLSVLLPDLRPYHHEDRDRWTRDDDALGDRVEIALLNDPPLSFVGSMARLAREDPQDVRASDDDLAVFDIDPQEVSLKALGQPPFFIPEDASKNLVIHCAPPGDQPASECMAMTVFRDDLALTYRFAPEHLPDWQRMDREVRQLLDSLSVELDAP